MKMEVTQIQDSNELGNIKKDWAKFRPESIAALKQDSENNPVFY